MTPPPCRPDVAPAASRPEAGEILSPAQTAARQADDQARLGIDAVELVRVRLPLRRALRSGHGVETVREVVLVRMVGHDGVEGWGECSALEAPTYTGEYTDGAWAVLRDHLVPPLLAGRPAEVRGHPFASASLRFAQRDLELRRHDRSAATAGSAGLAWTAVLGIPESGTVEAEAAAARQAGARAVKVKVRPAGAQSWLARSQDALAGLPVAVDANGGFRDHEAELVALADELAARWDEPGSPHVYVEQPLPADDLLGHAALAARLAVPVALDESIGHVGDVDTAWALGAAALVNVKPAKWGGVGWWSVEGPPVAVGSGPGRFLGGMLETGVGRATVLGIGAAPGHRRHRRGPQQLVLRRRRHRTGRAGGRRADARARRAGHRGRPSTRAAGPGGRRPAPAPSVTVDEAGSAWRVERHRGPAGELHALDWPRPLAPTVWLLDVVRPALVLGSTQAGLRVDGGALAARGIEVAGRRSGGGAVLLVPGPVRLDRPVHPARGSTLGR